MAKKKITAMSLNNPVTRRDFLKGMGMIGIYTLGGSVLASCAPNAPATDPTKVPTIMRNQVNWILQIQYSPFYAAEIKGFYAEEGLDAETLAGGPGIVSMRVLDAGQSEVSLVGSGDAFINALIGGGKNVMFATEFQRSPAGLMYLKDNPIETPQDAIGKRIGLQEGATQAWLVTCMKNNIDVNDMEIVTVGYDPTVLVDGTVDGYWCYATSQPGVLRMQGHEVGVLDPWIWGNRSFGNFCLVREDYLKSNREDVVKWLRASIRGMVYANTHIEEMVDYTMKKYGAETGLDSAQQFDEAKAQIAFMESDLTKEKGLFWFDKEIWQENVDTLVEIGELEADIAPTPDELSTYEVLEEVYKDGIDSVYKPVLDM